MGWLRRLALVALVACFAAPAHSQSDFGRTIVRHLKGPAVASASTITPQANYDVFSVTGTTTINYITTTGFLSGRRIVLVFAAALTVTHNAGSVPANTAPILLRGATNLTTAANLAVALVYDGANWIDEASAGGGPAGGAPDNAQYIVSAADGTLSAERVLTDTATMAWDFATAGQAKVSPVTASITYAMLQNVSAQHKCLGRVSASAGPVEEFDCTAAGRAILDDATAGDQRNTLGLGTIATQAASAVAITGGTGVFDAVTGLGIKDTDSSHKLVLQAGSNLGADRILTLTTGDSARTLTLNGDTTLSGTNTGDQTITLTSDVTGAGTGSFATTIANNAVTFAKMADIATDRLIGRDTASTGDPEAISVGGGLEFSGSTSIQRSALTGDVTATAGSNATTIANDVVTYAKLQNVSATDRILGRDTAGAGDVEELTVNGGLEFTGTGIQRSALTGDVTASAGSGSTTIANDAVTFGKFQNITDARLLGRSAGSSGDMQEITVGNGLSLSAGALTGTLDISGLTAGTVFNPFDDQIPIYDDSAAANRKMAWDDIGNGRNWTEFHEDFISGGPVVTNTKQGDVTITIGAGTAAFVATNNAQHPGVMRLSTSTGTTDTIGLMSDPTAIMGFGGGKAQYSAAIKIPTLSTAAQRFYVRTGFGDSTSAAPTDGCGFRVKDDVIGGEWEGWCTNNTATATLDTNVPPVADTWQNLSFEVNAAGTSVEFFIDGSSVGTIVSNIPSAASLRTFGIMPLTIIKSAGTTARTADIDYYRVLLNFTTAR
jgi:hypothetical protein